MLEQTILVIPSSPPVQYASLPQSQGSNTSKSLKRAHAPDFEHEYEPSSDLDPPIFSSDDWLPREYLETSKKARHPDSDAALTTWDEESSDQDDEGDVTLTLSSSMTTLGGEDEKLGDEGLRARHANLVIEKAIEEGSEKVDLSYLSLQALPSELQALSSLISQPHFPTKNPHNLPSSYFAPLTPSLHLFLGNNNLTCLSSPLFTLNNLTVLSIRNNQLTEIPEWISRLRNLRRLNFGGNEIQAVPWSLLKLEELGSGMDEGLGWWPNPLLEMPVMSTPSVSTVPHDEPATNGDTYLKLMPTPKYHQPIIYSTHLTKTFINSTSPTYYNLLHQLLSSPPPTKAHSRVPSLLESCLRTLCHHPLYAIDDETPPHLQRLVDVAVEYSGEWNKRCTVCGGGYVISAAEWVEWWQFEPRVSESIEGEGDEVRVSSNPAHPSVIFAGDGETDVEKGAGGNVFTLPMRRRVCSWGCAGEWEKEGELRRENERLKEEEEEEEEEEEQVIER